MADALSIGGRAGAPVASLKVWLEASRAWTLTVSSGAVLVGTAVSARAGYFSLGRFLMTLAGTVAIQAGTNMINDYYDYRLGADPPSAESPDAFGPSMVIQRGLLSPESVWRGGIACFAAGAVVGLVLTYLCGWPILALGLASVAAGYFYTARPIALAYIALGDITSFLFLGPAIVLGTCYVMTLGIPAGAVLASVSVGFLGAGILLTNNLRDIESDLRHGKRTVATFLGRRGAIVELMAFNAGAYVTTLVGISMRAIPWPALVVLATLPRAIGELRIAWRESAPSALNRALSRSAQLHLEFCLLLSAAFLAAAWLRI